jgi:hypothetical protein
MTMEDLARMVFEDIEPRLWDVMWNAFDRKLNDFMKVLFLVYFAQCQPDALEWISQDINSSDSQVLP